MMSFMTMSPMRSGTRRFLAAGLIVLAMMGATLGGCTTNPATGRTSLVSLMSPEEEAAIGAREHPKILQAYGGAYDNKKISAYVADITARMMRATGRPNPSYQVTVLDSPVVNAFALPGGYVYVTRGLMALANSEAELAAVIGHEIGHVEARHSSQRQTAAIGTSILGALVAALIDHPIGDTLVDLGNQGILAGYSRGQELEADELGVRYLAAAGYSPYAEAWILQAMGGQTALHAKIEEQEYDPSAVDWFGSHPPSAKRVEEALAHARATGLAQGQGEINRETYLSKISGMTYGDNARQGYVRGRQFIHPEQRFAFEVPAGFSITNTPKAIFARNRDQGVQIQFDGASPPAGASMTDYIANGWARGANIQSLDSFTTNGLPAATALVQSQSGYVQLVAIRFAPDTVYRFVMAAPMNAMRQGASDLSQVVKSFRKVSAAEARKLKPRRVQPVTVKRGQSLSDFARRMPFEDYQLDRFLALNGLAPDATLQAGQTVKLIVE